MRAAIAAAVADVTRYPDGNGFELKAALSQRATASRRRSIVLGNGSNDVLELVDARVPAAGRRGRVRAARVRGLSARDAGARRDAASRCRRATTATTSRRCARRSRRRRASCSSPIRTTRPARGSRPAELEAFIASVPRDVLVVLDEAYNEYLDPRDRARQRRAGSRATRISSSRARSPRPTASPALRVGYGVMHADGRRHAEPRAPAVQRQRARAGGRRSRRSPTPSYVDESRALNARACAQLDAGLRARSACATSRRTATSCSVEGRRRRRRVYQRAARAGRDRAAGRRLRTARASARHRRPAARRTSASSPRSRRRSAR